MQYGKAAVRDAWNEKDLGVATGQITATVASHDIAVRVLTPMPGDDDEALPPTVSDDDLWREQWRGHGIKYPASRREREREKALLLAGKKVS